MNTKKLFVGTLGLVLALGAVGASLSAYAKDNNNQDREGQNKENVSHDMKLSTPGLDLRLMGNGSAMLRGAQVTGVNGTTITATTSFGTVATTWTIVTDGSTKFGRHGDGASNIGEIAAGDVISVQGMLGGSLGSPTITAKSVKDFSIRKSIVGPELKEGTVVSIAGTSAPTSIVVTIDGTQFTVNIATDTAVLGNLWQHVSLANFQAGQHVRVYGVVNGTTINATVIRNTNL